MYLISLPATSYFGKFLNIASSSIIFSVLSYLPLAYNLTATSIFSSSGVVDQSFLTVKLIVSVFLLVAVKVNPSEVASFLISPTIS